MVIIFLRKSPKKVGGKVSHHLQEIAPGLFVGNVSCRVREKLWDSVKFSINNGSAVMVYSFNNEQGFLIKRFGFSNEISVDLDGLILTKFLK